MKKKKRLLSIEKRKPIDYENLINERSLASNIAEIVLCIPFMAFGVFLVKIIAPVIVDDFRSIVFVLMFADFFILFFIPPLIENISLLIYRIKAKNGEEHEESYQEKLKIVDKVCEKADYISTLVFIIIFIMFPICIIYGIIREFIK